VCAFPRKTLWLLACIAKLMGLFPVSGWPKKGPPLRYLSGVTRKCHAPLSGGREAPDLPGSRVSLNVEYGVTRM
jgi:hypothetical protein